MKKAIIALSLTIASTVASAATFIPETLRVIPDGSKFNKIKKDKFGDKVWGGDGSTLDAGLYANGSEHQTGTLVSNIDGYFFTTYLGKASDSSQYAAMVLNTHPIPGQTSLSYIGAFGNDIIGQGSVPFRILKDDIIPISFYDGVSGGAFTDWIANGEANTATEGILYLDATPWNEKHNTNFAFLVAYNDKNGSPNYDDVVVGVSAEVPVPAAFPLMASALGLFGLGAKRRKALKA